MGLGKSLSIISLLATDWVNNGKSSQWDSHRPTLLIVPFPLLGTWEKELSHHLYPNTLTWQRYHGPKRHDNISHLLTHDVVITTYETVAFEWQNTRQIIKPLFSTTWRRIVINEGKSPSLTDLSES